MILVPVKNLSNAKQRLASLLDQPTRRELAQAMLLDVLSVLSNWASCPEVGIVTTDPHAMNLATKFGFEVIQDNNISETAAIELATQVCESRGVNSTLVIPGDIPLIHPDELEQIMKAAPAQGSVLVPAADGRGTNAAYRRPAGLFPLRFGNDSFKPHRAAAQATGLPCAIISLPGIALDIDKPSDLLELAAAPGRNHSQQLVRQWNLTDVPLAAGE
jgi:2-phospho-L-lactate/phosphoenolpyruvate guanylyltransferase